MHRKEHKRRLRLYAFIFFVPTTQRLHTPLKQEASKFMTTENHLLKTAFKKKCQFSEHWIHAEICLRNKSGMKNCRDRLKHHRRNLKLTKLKLFEILFPIIGLNDVQYQPQITSCRVTHLNMGNFYNLLEFGCRLRPRWGSTGVIFGQEPNRILLTHH